MSAVLKLNRTSEWDAFTSRRILATASELRATLGERAAKVDAEASFPTGSLQAIRSSGLMGLVVPREFGGEGASFSLMAEVCQSLAEGCVSSAMIWGMHCQQVATIADFGEPDLLASALPAIARGDVYIASITSERGKGGELLTANAPLRREDGMVVVDREAPVVTGGLHADSYLITMRRHENAHPTDVALAYVPRRDAEIVPSSGWRTMGMRGTQSGGLKLNARIPERNIVGAGVPFRRIATTTMVPVGHIAWAAVWTGAARGAYRRFIALLRDPRTRRGFDLDSDLFASRLARIRLDLDQANAFLYRVAAGYDELRSTYGLLPEPYGSPAFNLRINGLKVSASETSFSVINQLVQLAGLTHGYVAHSATGIERTFRDLRSAQLMYANDKLYRMNGKLALLDREVRLA